jgi:hypothetical protein
MAGISVALIILLLVARFTKLDVITRQFWILPLSVGLIVASRLLGGKGRKG